jgi:hypothetical protein
MWPHAVQKEWYDLWSPGQLLWPFLAGLPSVNLELEKTAGVGIKCQGVRIVSELDIGRCLVMLEKILGKIKPVEYACFQSFEEDNLKALSVK